MKDWYEILGVDKKASLTDIKYAYRTKALKAHPDHGGDIETMKCLNEAYGTLSDVDKRKDFDDERVVFEESDIDNVVPGEFGGYLGAGNIAPYSERYRKLHAALTREYDGNPLKKRIRGQVNALSSAKVEPKNLKDIFSFLRTSPQEILPFEEKPLTLVFASQVLMNFLAGSYDILARTLILDYLSSQMKEKHFDIKESSFYLGIYEIIALADEDVPKQGSTAKQQNLLFAFMKITDAAKDASHLTLPLIIPLFYHEPFRKLYAAALRLYWQDSEDLFEGSLLAFNGMENTKVYLQELREQIASNHDKILIGRLRRARLLYQFEKSAHERDNITLSAEGYREAAFQYLNWIPAFSGIASREMFMNLFLQIGVRFQQAAQLEENPTIKMADEKMALQMYLTTVGIAHHCTPDKEMYAANHVLRYLHAFEFEDETFLETVNSLEKRTLHLADVFPFFEPISSNLAFLKQENRMLYLMRQLLNALVNLNEARKNQQELILDHSAVTILYQAYEACLKNWYQENYEPELEQRFRINLMDELLFEKGWTSYDVEEHLHADYNLVNRDEASWLKPVRFLPYTGEERVYSSLDGLQFNHKTGEVEIFLTPWDESDSVSRKLFTLEDVEQLLEKKIDGAFFSLDPVDSDKPYHPFNQMRFSPSCLQETTLFHSMLLTDYMLKFFTTGQEVQGEYPFNQRSIETMLSHVPPHLKRIITNFQSAPHSGAIHRFWIEAEEVDVPISDKKVLKDIEIERLGLNRMRMVVKKHRMEWVNGELKDVGNEDEGWPIYVLKPHEWQSLLDGRRRLQGRAMIFIYGERKLFYWENHETVNAHVPRKFDHGLSQLYCKKKDAEGRIHPSSDIMPLLFWATNEMAEQSGMPHHYSSEFIFAQEFTEHYNEFAEYFPEFGRLRELSKGVVITRFLNHTYTDMQKKINILDYFCIANRLSPFNPESSLNDDIISYSHDKYIFPYDVAFEDHELYKQYLTQFYKIQEDVAEMFRTWRLQKVSFNVAQINWRKISPSSLGEHYRQEERAIELALQGHLSAQTVLGAHLFRNILEIQEKKKLAQARLDNHPYEIIIRDIRERIKIIDGFLSGHNLTEEIKNTRDTEPVRGSIRSPSKVCTPISPDAPDKTHALFKMYKMQFEAVKEGIKNTIKNTLARDYSTYWPWAPASEAKHFLNTIKPLFVAIHPCWEKIFKVFLGDWLKNLIQSAAVNKEEKALGELAAMQIKYQFQKELNEQKDSEIARLARLVRFHKVDKPKINQCFWVPASVNHKMDTTGLSRHSFFVYGGVLIQPKTNIQQNGLGLPRGNRVDGHALGVRVGIPQVLQNKIQGDLFRDKIAQQLRDAGKEVEIEVYKPTPFGGRYMDIEVRQNGVPIGGIETKTGKSRYTPAQRSKDEYLRRMGYHVDLVREKK